MRKITYIADTRRVQHTSTYWNWNDSLRKEDIECYPPGRGKRGRPKFNTRDKCVGERERTDKEKMEGH